MKGPSIATEKGDKSTKIVTKTHVNYIRRVFDKLGFKEILTSLLFALFTFKRFFKSFGPQNAHFIQQKERTSTKEVCTDKKRMHFHQKETSQNCRVESVTFFLCIRQKAD